MLKNQELVKHAYQKLNYTEEQINHILECMDPVTGPLYFMETFVYVKHPVKGRMQFKAYPFQKELLKNYHEYRYNISMISRQMGKSTIAACYLLWYATFHPDSTILIASHKHDGAKEIMKMIKYAYEELPDYIRAGATEYNVKSLAFDNGSTIMAEATTENTGRGKALTLVYLDEFAFVEPRIAREFWTALSPTLSTGGKCIITSTPNTDEDQFAEIWFGSQDRLLPDGTESEAGKNGFKGFKADWREHPDRDEAWGETERNKIGEERFKREHEVQFIAFEETLINSIKLAHLQGTDPIRLSGEVRWYDEVKSYMTYLLALDPSMGTGGDYGAIQVIEIPSMKQVAEWQNNKLVIENQLKVLREIASEIADQGVKDIFWTVENNTLGEAALLEIRKLGEEKFPGSMVHDPDRAPGKKSRKGFNTTNRNKIEACSRLKTWIEADKLKINSRNLISELKTFVAQGNTYKGKVGTHDDLVSAMLLAIRMTEAVAAWDDRTYDALMGEGANYMDDDEAKVAPMPIII